MPSPAFPRAFTPLAAAEPDHHVPTPEPTWTRSWHDPLNRPMTGAVSLTKMGRPAFTVTADLDENGQVALPLVPGIYRMVAVLFDADEVRAYDTDILTIG